MSEFERALRLVKLFGIRRMLAASRTPHDEAYMTEAPGRAKALAVLGLADDWQHSDLALSFAVRSADARPGEAWHAGLVLYDLHHNPEKLRALVAMREKHAIAVAEADAKLAAMHERLGRLR